ncbi:MAG: hypothetical protein OXI20_02875 [Rhodospirillales bacterium]|nr:hypothetical protein [Rhodospirillales bacterium]
MTAGGTVPPRSLVEGSSGAGVPRGTMVCAAGRPMEPEIEGLTGAAHLDRSARGYPI